MAADRPNEQERLEKQIRAIERMERVLKDNRANRRKESDEENMSAKEVHSGPRSQSFEEGESCAHISSLLKKCLEWSSETIRLLQRAVSRIPDEHETTKIRHSDSVELARPPNRQGDFFRKHELATTRRDLGQSLTIGPNFAISVSPKALEYGERI